MDIINFDDSYIFFQAGDNAWGYSSSLGELPDGATIKSREEYEVWFDENVKNIVYHGEIPADLPILTPDVPPEE